MTGARLLAVADLDRTLVFSPRAAAAGDPRPDQVVEVLDGRVVSLMAREVRARLAALAAVPGVVLLPATTRTREQFLRVDLGVATPYAVVASGGSVLVDGVPDPEWQRRSAARLAATAAPVAAAREVLAGRAGRPWLLRVREADEVFLVAAVDVQEAHTDEVAEVALELEAHGWRAVHQGRKLYVLPGGLHKADAVEWVRERVSDRRGPRPLLLAAGDSLLDAEMLRSADRGWVPRDSELDRVGFTAPHVATTAGRGHAAAEEVVRGFQQVADRLCAEPAGSPSA